MFVKRKPKNVYLSISKWWRIEKWMKCATFGIHHSFRHNRLYKAVFKGSYKWLANDIFAFFKKILSGKFVYCWCSSIQSTRGHFPLKCLMIFKLLLRWVMHMYLDRQGDTQCTLYYYGTYIILRRLGNTSTTHILLS